MKNYKKRVKIIAAFLLSLVVFNSLFFSFDLEVSANQDANYWGRFSSSYYYNNMNDEEKNLYNALYARCMSLLTSTETVSGSIGQIPCGLSGSDAMNVCFVFSCSNPQFYFLNDSYSTGYDPSYGNFCSIGVYSEFCDGNSREQSTNALLASLAEPLYIIDSINESNGDMTQLSREKYIYNYICDTVEYWEGAQRSQTCYSALVDKESVCAGYAEAFELLCRYAGIECIVVTSSDHEWNEVKLAGKWYAVDSTWGDESYDRNDCFNRATNNLSNSHVIESLWNKYGTPICDSDYGVDSYIQGAGIYVAQQTKDGILCGMVVHGQNLSSVQYRWLGYSYKTGSWFVIRDWTINNEWLAWNPDSYGDYLVRCEVATVDHPDQVFCDNIGMNHHPGIKGICQMPNRGGGYLIGIESYDNPNNAYRYELQIYDCTQKTWVYSTGRCLVKDKSFWTIWKPKYGYYWTLFRVYDAQGNILDEKCYGFANI
ncbi:Transglutaminase-like superfamily protein [Lachnospiraceae bacterium A10]|nr:Transglutaminase-like superfamily protein [Lachnospiraceae bacterium A10]